MRDNEHCREAIVKKHTLADLLKQVASKDDVHRQALLTYPARNQSCI